MYIDQAGLYLELIKFHDAVDVVMPINFLKEDLRYILYPVYEVSYVRFWYSIVYIFST